MNGTLAAVLVRIHDRTWRDRYGAECLELLAELPASLGVLADMAVSAAASRRAFLLQSATAAAIAVLLAVSATLLLQHGGGAAIAILHGPQPTAQPN